MKKLQKTKVSFDPIRMIYICFLLQFSAVIEHKANKEADVKHKFAAENIINDKEDEDIKLEDGDNKLEVGETNEIPVDKLSEDDNIGPPRVWTYVLVSKLHHIFVTLKQIQKYNCKTDLVKQ